MKKIVVIGAPDFKLISALLQTWLTSSFEDTAVECVDIESCVSQQWIQDQHPDTVLELVVILADPDRWDNAVIDQFRASGTVPVFMVFTQQPDPALIRDLVTIGQVGIMTFQSGFDCIYEGFNALKQRHYYLCDQTTDRLIHHLLFEGQGPDGNKWQLSRVEQDILSLARNGYDIHTTAEKLGLSKNTVAAYRSRIITKTGSRSILELVARLQKEDT